ncbi:MAG: hypothetical protein FJ246_01790 [Nitrospira sp.]|nr:hypothetical protein [Nitrospira sp.]
MPVFAWSLLSLGGPSTRSLVLFLLLILAAPCLAAPPDLKQPNAYAVVIGISQYREEGIPKVVYAAKDAEAIAQVLEKQAGIPKSHIKLMIDGKATGSDFHKLGDWLKIKVRQADSTVYLYYAGHGTPDAKTSEPSLVPWDGDPDFPNTLYPLATLYAALEQLPAANIVVWLDSCFSGAEGRSVLAKGTRPFRLEMDKLAPSALKKVIVMAAATGKQMSSDYDKAGHGLFTHAVLTGLQGGADTDKNGLVTLQELYPYVKRQVVDTAAEELTREQTPVLLPGEEVLATKGGFPVALAIPGGPVPLKPTVSLSQAEQELKALEEQERQVDEQAKQETLKRQIEKKKQEIEQKKRKLELAKVMPYEGALPEGLSNQSDAKVLQRDASGCLWVETVGRIPFGRDDSREQARGKALSSARARAVAFESALGVVPGRIMMEKIMQEGPQDAGSCVNCQYVVHYKACVVLLPEQSEAQAVKAPSYSTPKQQVVEMIGKDGAPMRLVSEGEFLYGENNKRLSLPAFYMDQYEVTTALYAEFMADTGWKAPEYWKTGGIFSTATWKAHGQKPVVGVDWHDADAYCRYYGKRLPTEQEWEKAARGTDGRTYPWGNDAPTSQQANFNRGTIFQDYEVLVNVGSLEDGKSPYGIYDLAGNVWEWTSSDYDSSRKVLRGGSWSAYASNMRSASRLDNTPTDRYNGIGFRCAKTP